MQARTRTSTRILLFAIGAATASVAACGEESGGPNSGPIVATGTAMASDVMNGKLTVSSMRVSDPALGTFAEKMKTAFGTKGGRLVVNFVKLRLDLPNSTGVAGLQDVFESTSATEIYLNPGAGEVRVGSIARPAGSSPVTASIVADSTALEPIELGVLNTSLFVVVRGPAKLTSGKVGLSVTFQLEAIPG